MVTVIVVNEEDVEFQKLQFTVSNKPMLFTDLFGNELPGMTVEAVKISKGTVIDWNGDFDEFIYILSGTQRFEEEGKTYTAKKGAFVLFKGGSKIR